MSNNTERKILFDIQVKTDSAIKKIADLSIVERNLASALKELNKDFEANAETIAEYETRLRGVKKEKSVIINLMDKETAANQAAQLSMDALTSQLSKLTLQYDKLSKEEQQNSDEGKRLAEQIKSVSRELEITKEVRKETTLEVNKETQANKAAAGSYAEIQQNIKTYKTELANLTIGSQEYLQLQDKLNKEVEREREARKTQVALSKAAAGSNNELKAQIIALTSEYDALSKEQRENSDQGKALTKRIKELSDELKENKKAIGDNRLEVGNYKEAIKGAIKENGGFVGAVRGSIAENTKFGKSIGDVSTAFKANPIGFFVSLLISLVSVLKESTEFMDFFNDATARVNAVIDVLRDRLISSAAGFKALFSGDFTKAAEEFKKSVSGINKELKDEFELAGKIVEKRKQLEKDKINNIARSKEQVAQEEKLKNIRDNEFNTIDKRIKANEDAAKIEKARLKEQAELAQRNIDLINAEITRKGGLKKINNEQLKELREAELELADIQEEAAGRENEFITERYGLEQEKIQQIKQARDKALQDQLASIEVELLKVKESSQEELELKEKAIIKQRDIELSAEGVTQNQRKLIIEKSERELALLRKEYADKQRQEIEKYALQALEAEKKKQDEFNKLREAANKNSAEVEADDQKKYEQELEALEKFYSRQEALIEQRRADGKINDAEYAAQTLALEEQRLKALYDLAFKNGDSLTELNKLIAKNQIAIKRKQMEDEEVIEQARLQVAKSSIEGLSSLVDIFVDNAEKAADYQKALALFQIGVDTASAISTLVPTAAKNASQASAVAGPAAPAVYAAVYAASMASGIAGIIGNIAKAKELLSEEPPQSGFYEGGEYVYNTTNQTINNSSDNTTNPYFNNWDKVKIGNEYFGYTGDGKATDESKALDSKKYTYHRKELIVNHETLATPEGAYYGKQLLRLMGKDGGIVKPVRGFFSGGIGDGGFATRSAIAGVDAQMGIATAGTSMVKEAFDGVNIEVAVTEIERKQNDRKRVRTKDGLR